MDDTRTSADHDAALRLAGPTRGYVIAALPASGAMHLADALWATDVAGRPEVYLDAFMRAAMSARMPAADTPAYLASLHERRTGANGTFGIVVTMPQIEAMLDEGATTDDLTAGVETTWVWVRRDDRFEQAVAWERGVQRCEGLPPTYDFPSIAGRFADLRADEQAWTELFTEIGVEPLELTHEELTTDFEWSVRRVLSHVGVPSLGPEIASTPPPAADVDLGAWRRTFERDLARAIADREGPASA